MLQKSPAIASAAWHALFWLTVANAVGVLIGFLLILPALNTLLGELTYGRWMMVHMNLELYGWTSLLLVAFLFKAYGAESGEAAKWCRPLLWAWSAALGIGSISWLMGHSTGKLFLDWSGYACAFFTCMLFGLWMVLLFGFVHNWRASKRRISLARVAQIAGLVLLLLIPIAIYTASQSGGYPAINPSTGGPTGSSQLESSLAVVAILLMTPFAIAPRKCNRANIVAVGWILLFAECALCAAMDRSDVSHHVSSQFLSLGSVLLWLPVIPGYYSAFIWNAHSRRWRVAFLWWWAALVATGWIFFLPGVLDHFKFTDGLVGHSFVAMAGFASSFLIFVMVQLLGEDGWIFNQPRAFYMWQTGVIAYIGLMTIAGWREGFDPSFTMVPGAFRNLLYILRLGTGSLMLHASVDWLVDCSTLLRQSVLPVQEVPVLEVR
jgi:cytochrome c oxidase cbb3-type subunit 1